jgi:sugar/nucleoside kinase (ribokinase family)
MKVLGVGNALVDILAHVSDDWLERKGFPKGSTGGLDYADSINLYKDLGVATEMSGGSVANTIANLSSMGVDSAFAGVSGEDQFGAIFTHDMKASGASYINLGYENTRTGNCLVMVSSDGERTMRSCIGDANRIPLLNETLINDHDIILLEGYMLYSEEGRDALYQSMRSARASGKKVILGASSRECVYDHWEDFRRIMQAGLVDILFANEEELMELGRENFEDSGKMLSRHIPVVVATRGKKGAFAFSKGNFEKRLPCQVENVIDTTGAGDTFCAGYILGITRGLDMAGCLEKGNLAASHIITRSGARFAEKIII